MGEIHVGRRRGLFGLGLAACGALMASVAPQDGTRYAWGGTWDANWVQGALPADGGIARLDVPNQDRSAHSTWKIDVNRTGIRLGGFDFGRVGVAVEGSGDITYVGDNPFIRIDYLRTPWNPGESADVSKWYPEHADVPNNSYCYRTCHYRLPIRGTGGNRLSLRGAGEICIDKPVSDFAEVEIRNVLMATNPAPGFAFTACDTTLAGEVFYWPLAGGDVSAGLATGHALTAGAGASLVVRNTTCTSATLALGTLRRGLKGTLTIQAQTGTLGGTEKVTLAGAAPVQDGGLVEPWIVGRDGSGQAHFLAYDAVDGFKPFAPTTDDLATAGEADIVRVSANVTLSESRKIRGLLIEGGATLTLADGVTLTVGGEAGRAAAVIVNATTARTYTPLAGQGGALDFGASEGFLWLSAHWTPTANDVRTDVRLCTQIRGSAGVTLAGARAAVDHSYLPSVYAAPDFNFCRWTGGTAIANVYLRATVSTHATVKENPFTDCGELYVVGGETVGGGALRLNTASADAGGKVWPNDLSLAGGGFQGRKNASDRANTDDTNGSIVQDGGGGRQRMVGRVTLVGDARVVAGDDPTAGFEFAQPIVGTGSLSVWQTRAQTFFDAVNTFRGKTIQVGTGAGVLSLRGAGTFGDGPAELEGTLQFADQAAPYVVTNQVTAGGNLELVRANVQLAGRTSVAGTARVYGATDLVLGEDVAFGALHAGSTLALAGATPDARLVLAGDGDSHLDMVTAGALPVVKRGAGTLTVHAADGGRTASATAPAIDVVGGTLRFESDIFRSPGLVYWLDASDASTFETDPTTGNVMKWRSKNGNGYFFAAPHYTDETVLGFYKGYGAQTGVHRVNGLNVLTFKPGNDSRNGLVGSRPVSQRTVFVVNVPRLTKEGQCLFGTTADYSFRSEAADRWRVSTQRTNYESSGGSYVNGAWTTTGAFAPGEPQIVTVRHPVDVRANNSPEEADDPPVYRGRDYERMQLGFQYEDVRTAGAFDGDIAEVLAFDTILTDDERKTVENYLAKKWGVGAELHADVAARGRQVVDPATAIRLGDGAVLDLNGHDQTIAALSGRGRIVNGAGGAAPVLTVTGPCDFDGVAEGVTLRFAGGAQLGAFGGGVPTNGLLYRLDAARPETLLASADGCVTNWASRSAGGVAFDWKSGYATASRTRGPVFQASCTAFGGRPGVFFDGAAQLRATAPTPTKTLFVVWNWSDAVENTSRPWSSPAGGGYIRKFVSPQYGDNVGLVQWTRYGDRVTMDGVPKVWGAKDAMKGDSLDQWAVPAGGTFLYGARLDARRAVAGTEADVLNDFGKGGYTFGEILAYDRSLSDDECRSVEAYLAKKWLGEGGIPSESDDVCVKGDVEIAVGADGTVRPVVVDGTLDAADATLKVVNAAAVPKGVRQDLVVADGIRRGFARVSSDREDLFEIVLKGLAYIGRSLSGLYLIFR